VQASAPRLVENGLDVAHFAFVHEGFLGDADHAEIPDYEVTLDDSGVCAKDLRFWQSNPDGTGVPGYVSYTYWVPRPLITLVRKTSTGPVFALLHPVTPVDEFHSIGWICVAMNYGHDVPDAEIRNFQDIVYRQDIPVVESQHPELLPLDLQAELHLRCDRTSIAYRQWLDRLGVGLGTS
jgi:phenylpropionate dioxygenase-like ring-hydroxylating dioxygenase large terminal subunit